MTEGSIIKKLNSFFVNYDYRLSNVFIYDWESDFFCVSPSGYTVEVEVKISKADFKADFKKSRKHFILKNSVKNLITVPGHTHKDFSYINVVKKRCPNQFYYACPEGLIDVKDIPEYAGLLYIKGEESLESISRVKTAKYLHKEKPDISKILLSKFYYLYQDLQLKYIDLKYKVKQMADTYNYNIEIATANKEPDGTWYQSKMFDDGK